MYYNGLVDTPAQRFGILPGAFNPPTVAHLALAEAALKKVDRVIFVLPETLPHKDYSGVSFETRWDLLRKATAHDSRFQAESTKGGLLIEIARELRSRLPQNSQLEFLCGRDAAERIVNWPYESPDDFLHMLREFGLLVAPRAGDYVVPERYRHRIATVPLAPEYQAMSATEVRRSIQQGGSWRHLVPAAIQDSVARLYGSGAPEESL